MSPAATPPPPISAAGPKGRQGMVASPSPISPGLSRHRQSTVSSPSLPFVKTPPPASRLTVPIPFNAARHTTASQLKVREPYKSPQNEKCRWKSPGHFVSIPEIVRPNLLPPQAPSPSPPPLSPKRWLPVGPSPDILPLPPVQRTPKAHAVFDAKVRKVLPRQKILDINPRDMYAGMERVGSGANGAVIAATTTTAAKRQVAIKRCYIEDHDIHHHTYILRELRIMGTLTHANLIALSEACLWGDYLWMAMELMTCSVFGLLYNVSVGLPESYAIRIASDCLEGLIFLHSKNYMHRDVKCENILLNRHGRVKLADFGLATPLNRTNAARLGTAKWMAPEVVSEEPYTENVDIWSLAITMIEMMDRVPPLYYLDGNKEIFAEILYGHPPNFNFTKPSPGMATLVRWMLDTDGESRPGAKTVLNRIKEQVATGALQCARMAELGALVQEVFPDQKRSTSQKMLQSPQ